VGTPNKKAGIERCRLFFFLERVIAQVIGRSSDIRHPNSGCQISIFSQLITSLDHDRN